MGLENWIPKQNIITLAGLDFNIEESQNIISLSETQKVDRLDAEYWNPKYDEIFSKIENNRKIGLTPLGELVDWKKGIKIGSKEYLDDGKYPFIRVSNLTTKGLDYVAAKFISPELFRELNSFQINRGEILFSKDATPGLHI